MSIAVQSPSETVSLIAPGRPNDNKADLHDFPFTSLEFWGEHSVSSLSNKWHLAVQDLINDNKNGKLETLELYIYGTTDDCSVITETTTQVYKEQSYEDDPSKPIPAPNPDPSPDDPDEEDNGDGNVWDKIHSIHDFLVLLLDWDVIRTLLIVATICILVGLIICIIMAQVVKMQIRTFASSRRETTDQIWTELIEDGDMPITV